MDPNVAHNYLVYGEYGHSKSTGADKESNSKAKFIIFRLKDSNSPGVYASNGSASIRLDPNGIVDEVSGLNDGQAVEDALVPIVKEKALSLPGGEKYLQKFDDKQTLIKLDNKMKEGEDLTKEELSFLYELDRPIATLDTYNRKDPRIPELRRKYNIEYALEKGIGVNELVPSLEPDNIAENLDYLLKHGADIDVNRLVSNLDSEDIAHNLDALLRNGTDIDNIVNNMGSYDIAGNLDTLLDHGADIDALASNVGPIRIFFKLGFLLKHGADINNIINNMNQKLIASNLGFLLGHGADANNVIRNLDEEDIKNNIDLLRKYGANLDTYQENN